MQPVFLPDQLLLTTSFTVVSPVIVTFQGSSSLTIQNGASLIVQSGSLEIQGNVVNPIGGATILNNGTLSLTTSCTQVNADYIVTGTGVHNSVVGVTFALDLKVQIIKT